MTMDATVPVVKALIAAITKPSVFLISSFGK
jgi:hypothetical protein